jgi:hypothetical protein
MPSRGIKWVSVHGSWWPEIPTFNILGNTHIEKDLTKHSMWIDSWRASQMNQTFLVFILQGLNISTLVILNWAWRKEMITWCKSNSTKTMVWINSCFPQVTNWLRDLIMCPFETHLFSFKSLNSLGKNCSCLTKELSDRSLVVNRIKSIMTYNNSYRENLNMLVQRRGEA